MSRPGAGGPAAGGGELGHGLRRPAWVCAACGAAWPCETARSLLLAEYAGSRVALAVYLDLLLGDAYRDLPDEEVPVLYERVVGWAFKPGLWPRAGL